MGLWNGCPFCVFPQPQSLLRPHRDTQTLVSGVYENHARDILGISKCKVTCHRAAIGMPNHQEGSVFAELGQCVVQLEVDLRECARLRARVAPGVTGAIVSADARKGRDLVLNENPVEGVVAKATFDHDGRSAFARAMDVEPMPAEVNQFAWCRRRGGPYERGQ